MKAEGKKKTSWSRVQKAIYNYASEASIFIIKKNMRFFELKIISLPLYCSFFPRAKDKREDPPTLLQLC